MTPLLEFNRACFDYHHSKVLRAVSFTLHQGASAALIGANGAGKTTLLRLASGALTVTSGEIFLEGKAPHTIPHRQRAHLVAMVPQQLEVPFDFTVQQIVEQGRTPYLGLLRGPMREDHLAIDRALELTDTKALRHRIFNELSGGERQRVKIALGLAQEAKLLLLDEPTQNLDIGRQAEFIDLLHRLQAEGITILASIHDLHLVHDNFATVHLLNADGSLISGTPSEILTPDNIAQAFHCSVDHHPFLRHHALLEVAR
jgi:iron complex transport system ATP-binding protein